MNNRKARTKKESRVERYEDEEEILVQEENRLSIFQGHLAAISNI